MPTNPFGVLLRNRHAGHHKLLWARPELNASESFTLSSPAFDHGALIPEKHRGHVRGDNISPELNWTQPPPETVELALIVQDPDVPLSTPGLHTLAIGIDPSLRSIPENGLAHPSPVPGIRHGKGVFGHRGYAGPMPPRSHGPHTYVFQLFALDKQITLPEAFTLEQLAAAISGHVIARARLDGVYENK